LRVLRPGGRFVIHNSCPQECPDWLFYVYFPEALTVDLEDFWPPETVKVAMERAGFDEVTVELQHLRFAQDLRAYSYGYLWVGGSAGFRWGTAI
jgi:hypothetical protein